MDEQGGAFRCKREREDPDKAWKTKRKNGTRKEENKEIQEKREEEEDDRKKECRRVEGGEEEKKKKRERNGEESGSCYFGSLLTYSTYSTLSLFNYHHHHHHHHHPLSFDPVIYFNLLFWFISTILSHFTTTT